MKLVNKVLVDADDNPIPIGDNASLTLGLVLMNAALAPLAQGERKQEETLERYMLAMKMRRLALNETFEVTPNEAAMLKPDVNRIYPTLIAGQTLLMMQAVD